MARAPWLTTTQSCSRVPRLTTTQAYLKNPLDIEILFPTICLGTETVFPCCADLDTSRRHICKINSNARGVAYPYQLRFRYQLKSIGIALTADLNGITAPLVSWSLANTTRALGVIHRHRAQLAYWYSMIVHPYPKIQEDIPTNTCACIPTNTVHVYQLTEHHVMNRGWVTYKKIQHRPIGHHSTTTVEIYLL